jgi:hypothetical protein
MMLLPFFNLIARVSKPVLKKKRKEFLPTFFVAFLIPQFRRGRVLLR